MFLRRLQNLWCLLGNVTATRLTVHIFSLNNSNIIPFIQVLILFTNVWSFDVQIGFQFLAVLMLPLHSFSNGEFKVCCELLNWFAGRLLGRMLIQSYSFIVMMSDVVRLVTLISTAVSAPACRGGLVNCLD